MLLRLSTMLDFILLCYGYEAAGVLPKLNIGHKRLVNRYQSRIRLYYSTPIYGQQQFTLLSFGGQRQPTLWCRSPRF